MYSVLLFIFWVVGFFGCFILFLFAVLELEFKVSHMLSKLVLLLDFTSPSLATYT